MGGFVTQDIAQALINTAALWTGGVVAIAGLMLLGWALEQGH